MCELGTRESFGRGTEILPKLYRVRIIAVVRAINHSSHCREIQSTQLLELIEVKYILVLVQKSKASGKMCCC